jgi:hypothetical protein
VLTELQPSDSSIVAESDVEQPSSLQFVRLGQILSLLFVRSESSSQPNNHGTSGDN